MNRKRQHAFSLIELIITITLTAIIFSVVGVFLAVPIQGYTAIVSRAELVDAAELALRRMERDIRSALPNSVRISGARSLEMIPVVEGLRYRAETPGTANEILSFDTADSDFNVFLIGNQFQSAQLGSGNYRVVIYNIGEDNGSSDNPTPGANAYGAPAPLGSTIPPPLSHVITSAATTATLSLPGGSEGHINLSPAHQFAFSSPRQRLYLVNNNPAISYLCDTSAQTITRYENYTLNSTQPTTSGSFSGSVRTALLTDHVTACNFVYQPGTATRGGIVTLSITISSGAERIRLMQQVGVNNAP